jgi:hypothetical protein
VTTPQKQHSTPQKRAVVNAEAGPSKLKPQGASPAYVRVLAVPPRCQLITRALVGTHSMASKIA